VKRKTSHLPVCICGSKEFNVTNRGRNAFGRNEFRLRCRKCHSQVLVDKTIYALFSYIGQRQPSAPFLKLYDLQ